MSEYVQYGAGLSAPPGWRNFDASPTLRLQKIPFLGGVFRGGQYSEFPVNMEYGDIIKGLPVAAGSCRAVYCSHVLEHLALEDCRRALANTYSYLAPHGVFRFVLPDLEHLAKEYLESSDDRASITFITESGLGRTDRPAGLKGLARQWLGHSHHRWLWDFKGMALELRQVGFREIRRADFHDSQDSRFLEVEEADRWKNCLGIECSR